MVTALRVLRVKTGKTLRQIANELRISEIQLCRIERGQSYIPPHLRQKLADFFSVSVSEICDEATGWPILVDMEMPKLVRKA
ncbi:helix-turn-helix domain-containing protein [Carboxydothermus hydrogenoformans]|uniref:helix-turn-helix domain-containing protein n=1 Tax=Carboxydothermus hydrogenoformans TaxID=129958 RepID=UPI000315FBFC|nr:helix-turn-helix transcriptional regulator [Carboxydothermus hydrogenoformans]